MRASRVAEPALFVFFDLHEALMPTGGQAEQRWRLVRRLRDLEAEIGTRRQAIVLVAPDLVVPAALDKDVTVLDLPLPGPDEARRLLLALVRRRGVFLDPLLEERFVRACLGLTEREVKRNLARIMLSGGNFSEDDLAGMAEAKRQMIRRSRYLEYYDEVGRMDQVGGMGALKRWLERRALAFTENARAFGLPEPKGLFLLGVQGCGKSLMAKAAAGLFHVPLLRLDIGEVFAGGGVEEASLRATIRVAESVAPAVLWIDELEKAFATGDASGRRSLGVLLTWMQEKKKPVFVVATANEVRDIPPELLRKGRFDELFFVDLPDVHERLEILDIHLRARGRDPERFDLLQAAEESEKYSGAELEQVVVEALFNAFAEQRELSDHDIINTLRETVPLAITMDERLKELRDWARPRTRPASTSRRRLDFFQDFEVEV